MRKLLRNTWPSAVVLAGACLLPGPVSAAPVTIDWDVVPREGQLEEPTPHYSCVGDDYTMRDCSYLWQEGIELSGDTYSFWDDRFFEGMWGAAEDEILTSPGPQIVMQPRCEPKLVRCFDEFTPLHLDLTRFFDWPPDAVPSVYVLSSRGGLLKISGDPNEYDISVDFAGAQWERVAWLKIGTYTPRECESEDPPSGCEGDYPILEKPVLTFEPVPLPVPEPGALALLAAGAIGTAARRRGRRGR